MAVSLEQRGEAAARPAGPIAEEIARLELLRRLSRGAAHTLNNAFTAILGETLCLLDERKHDPLVAEACSLIQQEVERCARLTRSVAMRVQRRDALIPETDVSGLFRGLEPLLRETVSRAIAIACVPPPVGLSIHGGVDDLEILLLLTAHRLVGVAPGGGELCVTVETDGPHVDLTVALRLEQTSLRAVESAADPAWEALVDTAAHSIAERCRVTLLDAGPHAKRLRASRAAD
jgi:signal transduction histidine kinase